MPKAAKNTKPIQQSARPSQQTGRKSPLRGTRAQLIAAGLLRADGGVVGLVDHADAGLFARAASLRLARDRFDDMHAALLLAQRRGRAIPAGFRKACVALQAAEKAILAHPPQTPDGVAVLLAAAAQSADDLPASQKLTAAALRGFQAFGL